MEKIIAILVCTMFIWSCNQSPDSAAESPAEAIENHDDHAHEKEPLELNIGENRVVKEDMKPCVRRGHELVHGFIAERRSDYHELAEQWTEQNNQWSQSCTIEGKSHDELQKWLRPHLELVQELKNENDAAEADKIVLEIQQSYLEYQDYFD